MKFSHSTLYFTIALVVLAVCCFCAGYILRDVQEAERQLKSNVCTVNKLCPNSLQAIKRLRGYQIEVYNDSTAIYDGDRHVITLQYDSTQSIDKAISFDNQ